MLTFFNQFRGHHLHAIFQTFYRFEKDSFFLWVLTVWIALELLCFVCSRFVAARLQPLKKPHPHHSNPCDLVHRIMDAIDNLMCYSPEKFVTGFFLGCPIEDVYNENFRSFLAWAMFASEVQGLSRSQTESVDVCHREFCRRYNISFPPGYNRNCRHVSMSLDELKYYHRPLALYIVVGVLECCGHIVYQLCGFQKLEHEGVSYWYRGGGSDKALAGRPPLLFFHGICAGWLGYFSLINELGKGRAILLIDLNAIKILRVSFDIVSSAVYSSVVMGILERHSIAQVSVAGHSFGTITAGWFVRFYPAAVTHITLIDPVSLLLGLPDVAYSFLYRPPATFVQWMIYVLATTDLTVAHTMYRNFWWYRNVLWLEDIPPSIGVVVAIAGCQLIAFVSRCSMTLTRPTLPCSIGSDEILNPAAVHEYAAQCRQKLSNSSIEIVHWPSFSHAHILVSPSTILSLGETVRANEKRCIKLS